MSADAASTRFTLHRDAGSRFGGAVRRAWGRKWVRILAYLAAIPVVLYFLLWLLFARDLPSAESLLNYEPPLPTYVRDINGEPVQTFARERRVQLAYDEFRAQLINAFLAAEDRTFFTHGGIDYPGLVGAVVDYVSKVGSGERARGGSTITQQVAKNLFSATNIRSPARSARPSSPGASRAVLTKQQILELYLNQIFLGRNAYGVQAAARAYFDKDVDAARRSHEFAYPRHPAQGAEQLRSGPRTRARARAAQLGARRDGAQRLHHRRPSAPRRQAEPLGTVRGASNSVRNVGGYFMEEVRRQLIARYGEQTENGPEQRLCRRPVGAHLATIAPMQQAAETALRDGLMRYERGRGWRDPGLTIDMSRRLARRSSPSRRSASAIPTGGRRWCCRKEGGSATHRLHRRQHRHAARLAAVDAASAAPATAAFDVAPPRHGDRGRARGRRSGRCARSPKSRAAWSSRRWRPAGSSPCRAASTCAAADFNRATQAQRQPGSTFKPIVYSAALDNGMTPASIIVDGPFCVNQGTPSAEMLPQLLGRQCRAADDALGPRAVAQPDDGARRQPDRHGQGRSALARRMGVGDYPNYLAIALGAGDTTVLQDDQRLRDPRQPGPGAEADPDRLCPGPERQGDLPRRHPALRRLQRAATGTAGRCRGRRCAPAGGRSDDRLSDGPHARRRRPARHRAASCATSTGRCSARPAPPPARPTSGSSAASPQIVAGVYMGFDQPRPMGGYAQGGTLAAPIFRQFARDGVRRHAGRSRSARRTGIRMVRIDRRSGQQRVRRLADRRPARGGDLGSVQARKRAAAHRSAATRSANRPPEKAARTVRRSARTTAARQRLLAKRGRDLLGRAQAQAVSRRKPGSSSDRKSGPQPSLG